MVLTLLTLYLVLTSTYPVTKCSLDGIENIGGMINKGIHVILDMFDLEKKQPHVADDSNVHIYIPGSAETPVPGPEGTKTSNAPQAPENQLSIVDEAKIPSPEEALPEVQPSEGEQSPTHEQQGDSADAESSYWQHHPLFYLGFEELHKREGQHKDEELKKESELNKDEELKKESELNKDEELKKEIELNKDEELKKESELTKDDISQPGNEQKVPPPESETVNADNVTEPHEPVDGDTNATSSENEHALGNDEKFSLDDAKDSESENGTSAPEPEKIDNPENVPAGNGTPSGDTPPHDGASLDRKDGQTESFEEKFDSPDGKTDSFPEHEGGKVGNGDKPSGGKRNSFIEIVGGLLGTGLI